MSAAAPRRYTLTFAEADPADVQRLGGKGAGLAEMVRAGLPVPPGFVIGTDACRSYLDEKHLPDGLAQEIDDLVAVLEEESGKTFGSGPHPLLLSVRSGAPISMPGMMDTVLDLGLSRDAGIAMAREVGDTLFLADLVRRFHAMYAETVLGALEPAGGVGELIESLAADDDPVEVYDRVWDHCDAAVEDELGVVVPRDPQEQLRGAVEAVFGSWNTRRARTYRDFHDIPHTMGTAVVVQSMVFGNLGADSGSGVVFTRNPVSGEPEWYGEFLADCQGEDVVSGEFTPEPIEAAEADLPEPFARLREVCEQLEQQRRDVLDIEFTVERGALYLLQVRSAKRTAEAAVRFAADFLADGIEPAAALAGVGVDHVRQIQRPTFDEEEVETAVSSGRLLATGTGASPGQVSGRLVLDSDEAQALAAEGEQVVLARPVTSPADLHGMIAATGILTATGGATSHAAVVARALGRPCVVGCADVAIDPAAGTLSVGDTVLHSGDDVSIDGAGGQVYAGVIKTSRGSDSHEHLVRLTAALRELAPGQVLARVTSKEHVDAALQAGADGLVTALDDVLAATGHLDTLVAGIVGGADSGPDLQQLRDVVGEEVGRLLSAADGAEMNLRAIDLAADEANDFLQQDELFEARPELALPLGWPELLEAQLAGVAAAQAATGHRGPLRFAVRRINDAREAELLAEIRDRVREQVPESEVEVGVYVTTPRGVVHGVDLAGIGSLWVDLKTLQAGVLGIPSRLFLTPEPLDGYVKDGRLGIDPRQRLDDTVRGLLSDLAGSLGDDGGAGVRLALPVRPGLVEELVALGIARFAVELDEVRPMILALARATASA